MTYEFLYLLETLNFTDMDTGSNKNKTQSIVSRFVHTCNVDIVYGFGASPSYIWIIEVFEDSYSLLKLYKPRFLPKLPYVIIFLFSLVF